MIWKAENKHNNVNIRVINPGATRTKMRAFGYARRRSKFNKIS